MSLVLIMCKGDAEMSDGGGSDSVEGDVEDDESFASIDDLDGMH